MTGRLKDNLPVELRPMKRFLLWKREPHPDRDKAKAGRTVKVPYYVDGWKRRGRLDTGQELARLVTFEDAYDAFLVGDFEGLGLALANDGIGAFDIDHCLDEDGDLIQSHAGYELVCDAERRGAYIEFSPSGLGLRIVGPCQNPEAYSKDGVEYWGEKHFVTLTGEVWGNPRGWADLDELREALGGRRGAIRYENEDLGDEPPIVSVNELQSALDAINSDERELWVRIGRYLAPLGDKGKQLWMRWSEKSPKYSEADAERVWESFKPPYRSHPKAVFVEARVNWKWENPRSKAHRDEGATLDDFWAHMPSHRYIFAPTGELWPSNSVNSRLGRVGEGKDAIPAAVWLDQNRAVEQMTWAPGEPPVIDDRLISDGGWIDRRGCRTFNLYRPPLPISGNALLALRWVAHVKRVYPNEAEHIIQWLAHRVRRPHEKINHALVLGGAQGIGKDTLLEPVKYAVGQWNFTEVSPQAMLGRFNGFVKSVILRVSEARDLGDANRFAFYDHMKNYTAAPPDVLRVDEKHKAEYAVFNVCGVIITSNHKLDGIFLPDDDRRHFVAWSNLTKEDFHSGYWDELWAWYEAGGIGHVAAYLAGLNLSPFAAKAPPPKTEAFNDIVASNRAPEDAELDETLEKLGYPDAVTLTNVAEEAPPGFYQWLNDRKNSRKLAHRMSECGYERVVNPGNKRGQWKMFGGHATIYGRRELNIRERIIAAEGLVSKAKETSE